MATLNQGDALKTLRMRTMTSLDFTVILRRKIIELCPPYEFLPTTPLYERQNLVIAVWFKVNVGIVIDWKNANKTLYCSQ